MNLRDHPLMRSHGVQSWPPVWVGKYGAAERTGEIGKLTYVGSNPRRIPRAIFLHITHGSTPYCGSLLIEDPAFRLAMYELFQNHIGRTIQEIGDLDLAHLL